MTFFNNKEQVIKFELTPYGRFLMSQGKLKPHSYEFIDDDILYDLQQVGRSEIQNETFERVKFETPKLIPNPNKSEIVKINYINNKKNYGIINKHGYTKHQAEIGKSSPETVKTPALSMLMLDGKINQTLKVYNGNSKTSNTGSFENQLIPQIDFNLNYVIRRRQESRFIQTEDIRVISQRFNDGKVLYIDEDNIMSFVKESGSDYDKENFEIEVFAIESDESGTRPETLRQLEFQIPKKRLVNEMIIENNKTDIRIEDDEKMMVMTFFELLVDSEIDPKELCDNIKDIKRENIYIDDDLVCPQDESLEKFNIYATRVDANDLEDCD